MCVCGRGGGDETKNIFGRDHDGNFFVFDLFLTEVSFLPVFEI